jgi:hypothetical protein
VFGKLKQRPAAASIRLRRGFAAFPRLLPEEILSVHTLASSKVFPPQSFT